MWRSPFALDGNASQGGVFQKDGKLEPARSLADLETKIRRGDASTADSRDPDFHLRFERGLNSQSDFTIQPIARAIRKSPAVENPAVKPAAAMAGSGT